ncbi:MAG: hypothetical protein Q8M92_02265 [Candidatus Subteraquimicrobiales bacterium]|nr:hypothetical protein [Candidatus Subteraquimicrobiales bacterium]
MQLCPGVEVPIGAPLKLDEINRCLALNDRSEAIKEYHEAKEQAKEEKKRSFCTEIAKKYMNRDFIGVIGDIAYTDMEISGNLKELVKNTLLVYLEETISHEKSARKVIYALNKIGEKSSEFPWKEKIEVFIKSEERIIPLIRIMKDQWDNENLARAISNWELTQGISNLTLSAREEMGMPIVNKEVLANADKLLKDGFNVRAIGIYQKLKETGADINFDDKDRKEVLAVFSSTRNGDEDIKEAAIKAGIMPKPKSWWKF